MPCGGMSIGRNYDLDEGKRKKKSPFLSPFTPFAPCIVLAAVQNFPSVGL